MNDQKMWKWFWYWKMGRGWKNFEQNNRKHPYFFEWTVSRNMDVNDSKSVS